LLVEAVADLAPPGREAYYRQHGISEQSRAEVEHLLTFDRQHTDTLLAEAVASAAHQSVSMLQRASLPDRCGPFQPRELLGGGGMGTVWLARRADGEVEQVVAVKLLRPYLKFPRVHERFIQERRILASLSHPNIARLLDVGRSTNGQPYLAMEYVEGQAIDAYCEPLELSQRLRVFLKVCGAVFVRPWDAGGPSRSEAIEHPGDARG